MAMSQGKTGRSGIEPLEVDEGAHERVLGEISASGDRSSRQQKR